VKQEDEASLGRKFQTVNLCENFNKIRLKSYKHEHLIELLALKESNKWSQKKNHNVVMHICHVEFISNQSIIT
jgi:hypothetical protein